MTHLALRMEPNEWVLLLENIKKREELIKAERSAMAANKMDLLKKTGLVDDDVADFISKYPKFERLLKNSEKVDKAYENYEKDLQTIHQFLSGAPQKQFHEGGTLNSVANREKLMSYLKGTENDLAATSTTADGKKMEKLSDVLSRTSDSAKAYEWAKEGEFHLRVYEYQKLLRAKGAIAKAQFVQKLDVVCEKMAIGEKAIGEKVYAAGKLTLFDLLTFVLSKDHI